MKNYHRKTVLVTGATGLIGNTLVHMLMNMDDVRVIAISRSSAKAEKCFGQYSDNDRFVHIAQDIAQEIEIDEPVHYIFHAAGPISREIIHKHPLEVIFPNLTGTRNCCEFLLQQQQRTDLCGRMILFSSATVYGNPSIDQYMVREKDTDNGEMLESLNAVYSESKRMVEVIGLAYAKQYQMDIVIARFSYVYGYAACRPNTAFYEFIDRALDGQNIELRSNRLNLRDNIYVEDAVRGVLTVGLLGKALEVYNISSNGDGGNYDSVAKMASIVAETVKKHHYSLNDVKCVKSKQLELVYGVKMNNEKLKRLGWQVETNLQNGIEKTVAAIYQELMQKRGET